MGNAPWNGPLFIVGLPRSGTKLLRALLNNHPRIHIPSTETEFLPIWIAEWDRYGDLADYANFKSFHQRSVRLPYFNYQLGYGRPVDPRTWYASCRDYSVAGVFEALVRHDTGTLHNAGVIWGDKSPTYIRYMAPIAGTFPGARVIHIVRDVRDYCLSVENAWGKTKVRAAQRWVDSILGARQVAARLRGRYMELRYEDLLTDPEAEITRICRFLGVDFRAAMIRLDGPSEGVGDARNQSRIVQENSGKYLRKMRRRDLAAVEAIAGQLLRDMNYSLALPASERKRVRPALMRLYQLCDGVSFLRFMIRRRGIAPALRHWLGGVARIARLRGARLLEKTTMP
ncbi:MAG: sulfotransferase [Aquisalimonadaceae bacterium]